MADKKLNEVTKVTDMAYVPVIMADGSIGQIAKADLASVVAGVLQPLREAGSAMGSFDSITETGIYGQNGDVNPDSGLPSGFKSGVLLVFKCGYNTAGGGSPILQIFTQAHSNSVIVRVRWVSTWSSWSQL